MSEIFICKRGELTRESVKALRGAGVVVVESRDPNNCVFLRSSERVSNSDMLWAALRALNTVESGNYGASTGKFQRESFAKVMLELVEASRDELAKDVVSPHFKKALGKKDAD